MTLLQLRYVDTIARCGSFRKAAQELYVSQPALSKMVRSLEEELGITIFVRLPSGIALTAEGKELVSRGSRLLAQATDIKDYFRQELRDNHEEFNICSQHYSFVVDAFSMLQSSSEKDSYTYRLLLKQTPEIIRQVVDGDSSLGILFIGEHNRKIMGRMMEDNDLEFHPLFSLTPSLFVHMDHPLADKPVVTQEDLAPYPCILYTLGSEAPQALHEEFLSSDFAPAKTIIINDEYQSLAAMISGDAYDLGIGLITPLNANLGIVKRPVEGLEHPVTIGYITKNSHLLNELEEKFIRQIQIYAGQA